MNANKRINGLTLGLLLFLYLIVYQYVIPFITSFLTLLIDPKAIMINPLILTIIFLLFMLIIILLLLPSWRYAIDEMKQNGINTLVYITFGFFCLYAMALFLNVIISFFDTAPTSNNQVIINENMVIAPVFMIFSVAVFAPIVEESVFRAGIFEWVQQKSNALIANLVSSFCFGLIHVFDSLIHMDFYDLPFIIIYMGLGIILAHFYKNHGLIVSCGIHCLYNTFSVILMLLL